VILHGNRGVQGWLRYAQALAEQFTVLCAVRILALDGSERPRGLNTNPRPGVLLITWFLETQGLEGCRAIGFSLAAGWRRKSWPTTTHAFSKLHCWWMRRQSKPQIDDNHRSFYPEPGRFTQLTAFMTRTSSGACESPCQGCDNMRLASRMASVASGNRAAPNAEGIATDALSQL